MDVCICRFVLFGGTSTHTRAHDARTAHSCVASQACGGTPWLGLTRHISLPFALSLSLYIIYIHIYLYI